MARDLSGAGRRQLDVGLLLTVMERVAVPLLHSAAGKDAEVVFPAGGQTPELASSVGWERQVAAGYPLDSAADAALPRSASA